MALGKARYVAPAFFFVFLGFLAVNLILTVGSEIPPTDLPIMSLPIGRNLGTDVIWVIAIGIPILVVEYYLLAVPGAAVVLFLNRFFKAAAYDMDIMNLGREFGGIRMIRRAMWPALFSVSSSSMLRPIIRNYLFGPNPTIPQDVAYLYDISLSLMSSLLFMPVALLLFMPTWVLNDAGVVTHLKPRQLKVRQPPNTRGVGRWMENILGGYSLIAFPITMFNIHFYEPYVYPGGQVPGAIELTRSFLWVLGLPLFVAAFIVPVVIANEISHKSVSKRVQKLAMRFGASPVRKERIKKVKTPKRTRPTHPLEDSEIPTITEGETVVSSAKSVKRKKQVTKGKSAKKTTRQKSNKDRK